jgi:cytochrome c peroxidase
MHNGAFKSLRTVVQFLNSRDVWRTWPAPEVDRNITREPFGGAPLGDFGMNDESIEAIVAFLRTLSDNEPDRGRGRGRR